LQKKPQTNFSNRPKNYSKAGEKPPKAIHFQSMYKVYLSLIEVKVVGQPLEEFDFI